MTFGREMECTGETKESPEKHKNAILEDSRNNSEHPSNRSTFAREERDAKTVTYLDDLLRGTPGSLCTTIGCELHCRSPDTALLKHNGTIPRMGLSGVNKDNDPFVTTCEPGDRTHPVYSCNTKALDRYPNEMVYKLSEGLSDTHETAKVS